MEKVFPNLVAHTMRVVVAVGFFALSQNVAAYAPPSEDEALNFIEDLKKVYLTDKAKAEAVIGLEIELNGLTNEKIMQIIMETLGGEREPGDDRVKGTSLGDLDVYTDGDMWKYEDWALQFNCGRSNLLRKLWFSINDSLTAPEEIVLPPIRYSQIDDVERLTKALKDAGAEGVTVLSPAATQVNLQLDANDHHLLKRLMANYTRNKKLFSTFFSPAPIRERFLGDPTPQFSQKLLDYNYQPTPSEFWIDFRKGSHIKLSRLNIGPAMLQSEVFTNAEKEQLIAEGWGKRPAAEWREANTVFEEGYVRELVDVSIALLEASRRTGQLNAEDLRMQAQGKEKSNSLISQDNLFDREFEHSITSVLNKDNFVKIRIKKIEGAKTTYADKNFLASLGLLNIQHNSDQALKEAITERFAFEVVRPGEKPGPDAIAGTEVFALAYDDGYLGRGDGRATWLLEVTVPGVGTFDFGDKGGGPTPYVIPQESIDAGFHIGEKDGYLSLDEAIRTLQNSRILDAIGISAEHVVAIIETGKQTGFNLDPPDIQPTAKVIRAFENGLRGAHLRKYSDDELKRVARWLREREAVRLGRGEDIPPLATYLQNKIKRDARHAAIAKHFWVVHGAINPANIFEGGWADLNYVTALSVPDGKYTPLNVYSRLEYQHHEFFKTTKQFVDALSKAEPNLKIDTKQLFYEQFNNELTRLELISAGLTPAQAEKLLATDPKLAREYQEVVWKINFEYLQTDTRALKQLLPKILLQGLRAPQMQLLEVDVSGPIASVTRRNEYEQEPVFAHEMFWRDRMIYRLNEFWKTLRGQNQDQNRTIDADLFNHIASLTMRIARNVSASSKETLEDVLRDMRSQSDLANSIDLPTPQEIAKEYRSYRAGNKTLEEALAKSTGQITKTAAQVRQAYNNVSAQREPKTVSCNQIFGT